MCIYCDSDDLTMSDIIPYALTGAKLTKKFVCNKHNEHTNFEFEKDVIGNWDFFRNQLGLTTRDGKTVKFKANILIDDIEISNATLSDKKFFFSNNLQLLTAEYNGKKIKIGNIEKLKQIKGSNPFPLDMENVSIKYNFSLSELFASEKMKRTVAKISYEWHCLINNITNFEPCYEKIVSYIIDGQNDSDEEIVLGVIDNYAFIVANQLCELGTNSLYEYIDVDGYCYVIFNFWNVAIYKTRLFDTKSPNLSNSQLIHMYLYNLDGTKNEKYFGIMGPSSIMAESFENAIFGLQKLYLNNLKSLISIKVLSLFKVRQMFDVLSTDLELFENGRIDISSLLDYEEAERIFTIQLALKFAESFSIYDEKIGFNDNLMKILHCQEFLQVNEEEKIENSRKIIELDKQKQLTKLLKEGIAFFNKIYEIEKQKLE